MRLCPGAKFEEGVPFLAGRKVAPVWGRFYPTDSELLALEKVTILTMVGVIGRKGNEIVYVCNF